MSVNRAQGFVNYDNSSTSRFIPQIWSTKMLVKFYDATVLAAISNTDYEGEIKGKGDTVIIRSIPDVTIGDYVKGQDINYGTPESQAIELPIDKAKYWAIRVDDIDKAQVDIALMDKFTNDAAQQMKIAIDTLVLGTIYADVNAYNTGATAGKKSAAFNIGVQGSPVTLTKSNILDYFVDCGTVLDEQNIPEEGRFFVVPPWVAGMIRKSDLKDASLTGDDSSILRGNKNGRLGMIDRFTIYLSNNVSYYASDTAYRMLFGTKDALTFASQVVKTEQIRLERTFGDAVRGLNVFGFKVIKTEALGMLYAVKG